MKGRKMTHKDFLHKLREKNEHFRNGKFEVVGEYTYHRNRIQVQGKYGICSILAGDLIRGSKPSIKTAENPTKYFKNWLADLNNNYKNRRFEITSNYTSSRGTIRTKDSFGICEVQVQNLLHGNTPSIRSAIDKTSYWINMAKEIHDDKYDYSKVVYVNNKTKIEIICPIHGEFRQQPCNHIQGSQGCKICSRKYDSYELKDWSKMCPGNPGIFYILRCWNDDEEFYKVGITCTGLRVRYDSKTKMPYNYEIVKEAKSDDRKEIWNLEEKYKKLLKNHKYLPKIKFGGYLTECFTRYE